MSKQRKVVIYVCFKTIPSWTQTPVEILSLLKTVAQEFLDFRNFSHFHSHQVWQDSTALHVDYNPALA